MSVLSVSGQFKNLVKTVGRATVNSIYPNDIEFYSCAFEVVDANNKSVSFLLFPVMPESIRYSTNPITNIKHTAGGVVIMSSPTFTPFDINISGNFGRKFRLLVGQKNPTGKAISFTSLADIKQLALDSQVKSGYGVTKILEKLLKMCSSDNITNSNNAGSVAPFKMFFYDLSFNSTYMVEPLNFNFEQVMEKNMIWTYNINLKAVAPASAVNPNYASSMKKITQYTLINKAANLLLQTAKNSIETESQTLANAADKIFVDKKQGSFLSQKSII